jgi:hypothetical protein
MRPTDVAKDRIAFVSGSVLGWSILLAALWPRAAQLDTGATLRFNLDFQDFYVGNLISPEPIAFYVICVLVALGLSVAILAVSHLIAHGLLLVDSAERGERSTRLARFADATFISAFRVTWYVGIYFVTLLPIFPAVLLQHWLVGHWSIGRDVSSAVLTVSVSVPIVLLALHYADRIRALLRSLKAREYLGIGGRLVLLYCCYVAVSETAYTVALSSGQTLYSKAANPFVEASIRLGGATSALADATLEVRDEYGQVLLRPMIHRLGSGRFHAYFPTQSLSPGEYQLRLYYRRASLTGEFPYWHHAVIDSTFISLAP